jgi:hypothetical protein
MPMWISCTVKKASALATRRSQAAARSSAPPTQPPCTAQMTGKRAFSSTSTVCINRRRPSWKARRRRAVPVSSMGMPPSNTSSAMPALKWRPVDESTITRVSPVSSSDRTVSRRALKNPGASVFIRSGRFNWRWAMPGAGVSRRKKSWVMPAA